MYIKKQASFVERQLNFDYQHSNQHIYIIITINLSLLNKYKNNWQKQNIDLGFNFNVLI